MNAADYITVKQYADNIGLSKQRVNILVNTGKIAHTLIGGHKFIHKNAKIVRIKAGRPKKKKGKIFNK